MHHNKNTYFFYLIESSLNLPLRKLTLSITDTANRYFPVPVSYSKRQSVVICHVYADE